MTLGEGEGFGELALINDKPRSATIRVTEACQFIKVEKADYNRILKDIESNTIRLEEHGKEVVVLEKRVDTGTKVTGYVMMAGTPERLVRQLEENNDAGWSSLRTFPLVGNRGSPLLLSFIPDGNFPYDFLMTFRIFMTAQEVLTIFRTRYAPSSVFFFFNSRLIFSSCLLVITVETTQDDGESAEKVNQSKTMRQRK